MDDDPTLHAAPIARSGECWDFRCEKCRMKVKLILRQIGDMTIFDPVGYGRQGMLSAQLERYTPVDA